MTGLEPRLKIWFNTYLEPNYLDKNVLDIYYNAYVYNLKTYAKFFKCLFVPAGNIQYDKPPGAWGGQQDPFLKDSKGVDEEFMNDLLANGTYWHILLRKTESGYTISDGKHRLLAIKNLIELGRWPVERRLLAATNERIVGRPMPSNEVFYIPLAMLGITGRRGRAVFTDLRPADGRPPLVRDNFIHKPVSEQVVRIPSIAHRHVVIYSGLLRDAFYEFRLKTKSIYPPHRAINNEAEWENWKPEDFTHLLRELPWRSQL